MGSLSSPTLTYRDSIPRLLKDFLTDDSKSCSSNGFTSFPRKPCEPTVRNLLELDFSPRNSSKATMKLIRSRSRAASTTISAIHKASEIMINAVKHLPFTSVKSPSALSRSLSRRLLKREYWKKRENDDVGEISVTVKVKDILRWRSFRDLVEEKPPPLDFTSSTTTGSTKSSNSSSWCDSDFTSENLPFRCGNSDEYTCENEVEVGKKCLPNGGVGGDSMQATTGVTVDPKGELLCEEKEQHSPVSVLDFPFGEDEESFSSFHQNRMLLQKLQEYENLAELEPVNPEKQFSMEVNTAFEEANGIEEKAKQILNHVKRTSSADQSCEANTDTDNLLLDFFRHELTSGNRKDGKFDCEIVRVAKAWVSGEYNGSFEWEVDDKREAYIRDMERGVRWSKFEEEQEELASEMETGMLSYLVDELLVDLFSVC